MTLVIPSGNAAQRHYKLAKSQNTRSYLHPEVLVAPGRDSPGVEGEEVEAGHLAEERRAAAVPRSVQIGERVDEFDATFQSGGKLHNYDKYAFPYFHYPNHRMPPLQKKIENFSGNGHLPRFPCRLEFSARTRLNPTIGETSFEKGANGVIRGGRRDGGFSVDFVVVVDGVVEVVVPSVEVDEVRAASKMGGCVTGISGATSR